MDDSSFFATQFQKPRHLCVYTFFFVFVVSALFTFSPISVSAASFEIQRNTSPLLLYIPFNLISLVKARVVTNNIKKSPSTMEGIENHYPDNRAYQQIISTKKGILPLQETSTNTISSNSMLRNNKSLTSPVKPTTDQLNWKKRGATSPMPALTWHNSRRKLTKTSSIKADEENIPPIKQLRDNLNLEKPIDNDKTSHGIQSTHPVQQIKTTDDNTAFAVWPPKSLIEVELHRKLYLAEHRAKHYEELSEFLVLERRFQIEAGELSQSLAPHN